MSGLPLFSIIVPVYREQALIGRCLDMIAGLNGVHEAEVIMVDGGGGTTINAIEPRERPYTLAILESPKGRGIQLNSGAAAAAGDILIFLHVDSSLPHKALSLIDRAMHECSAGCFSLKIDTSHPFLRLGCILANIRTRVMKLPYGDQTYFVRKGLFNTVGGFQNIPIMEDVAFMLELKKRKIKLCILKQRSVTSERRWAKEGVYRGTFRNWLLFLCYRFGFPAQKLARRYTPHSE